jgi:class 3 adenylate cyclase
VRDAEVRYADWGGKSIAYEVFGSGPRDMVVYQTWCPIDLLWELPQLASFMESLGELARVIVFDPLGVGASDPLSDLRAATLEAITDYVHAVLAAVQAPRVVLFDATAASGVQVAATYPQHIQSLIVVNLRASFPELRKLSAAERAERAKGLSGLASLELHNPRVAHDPELRRWWGRARRLLTSPEVALAQLEIGARVDLEAILPSVRVPTLVLHRRDNQAFDIETSRATASRLPNARFVELPGSESDLFLGDTAPVLTAIKGFLAEPDTHVAQERPLATVLFTDIVASTEHLAASGDDAWLRVLDDHDETMGRIVTEYRGHLVRTTGDGILATFDGPARAVRCATELLDAANQQGVTLRAGLHTGEIELRTSDVAGIAVHIASRIADLASPGQILVSRTVVDLTAGSGLQFEPRGEHELKGVPGLWPTFAARPSSDTTTP